LDKIDPPHDIAIPGEVVGPVQIVLPLIVAQTRDLHGLRPPKELAGEIEHWLALKDRAIETLKRTLREGLLPDVRLMGPDWLPLSSRTGQPDEPQRRSASRRSARPPRHSGSGRDILFRERMHREWRVSVESRQGRVRRLGREGGRR
jgi:hypothetical protein